MKPNDPQPSRPFALTIIIAVYNGSRTIEQALASIRSQKSAAFEVVVIDGHSTDGTQAIVERQRDVVDQFLSEPDRGIYDAWNKGIALARGEWLAFLGADDFYAEAALSAYLAAAATAEPEIELISSRVLYHPNFGKPFLIGRPWAWGEFRRHMTIAHVGALHRRKLYERVGTYDSSYRICGDYELLLRCRGSLRAAFIPVLTVEMGGDGVSNNQLVRTFRETARAKHEAGGRSRLQCEIERHWDYFRAKVKRALFTSRR